MFKGVIYIIIVFSSFFHHFAYGVEKEYVCGISNGYPPYQFKNAKKQPTGFDADVLRLIFQKAKKNISFKQMNWDDVVGSLNLTNVIDCAVGMEMSEVRQKKFDFTDPYYTRKIAIFILADNRVIKNLNDLIGQKITGDRHSSIEALLIKKGIRDSIRIQETMTKEESMKLLKAGKSVAMIAPKEVGLYLAEQMDVNVTILQELDQGSPVAIAVKKGNVQMLNLLNNELKKLIKDGEIKKLYLRWFKQ